jgi:hypothetical protein
MTYCCLSLIIIKAAKKEKIASLVTELESLNPEAKPLDDLKKFEGSWKLLYSTITITVGPMSLLLLRKHSDLNIWPVIVVIASYNLMRWYLYTAYVYT